MYRARRNFFWNSEGEQLVTDNTGSHIFQPVAANPSEVSVCHTHTHAAATGKQAATGVLPPFSGELRVDKRLKLSNDDFKHRFDEFYKNKRVSAIDQLKATPVFPTTHVLAQIANMAYADYQREVPELPDSWKLLTTASHFGANNGYFGTAYWHPEHQQVVIAHRGTKITNVGAVVTDINGVLFNNYVAQMSSATTFANKVVAVLQEIEEEKGVSFELFFTGHSLGGWLAQITTFTTKYLEEKGGTFLNRRKTEEHESHGGSKVEDSYGVRESYHPHTVVFDSPGCKEMLVQMTDKLDVRLNGRSIDLQHLDITSYLSAPNRINTCNSHLGTVYRIFTDLSHIDPLRKRTPLYNLATHKMDKIMEAFDFETGQTREDEKFELKIRKVVDWPVSTGLKGGEEWKGFFKWAEHLNKYHPEEEVSLFSKVPEGYHPLRYQTKAYDECAKSLCVFTQDEREFLERYRWLCHVSEFFKPEDLFSVMNNSEAQKATEQKLKNFELGNESVRCPDASTLQALIPYVKRLVRLFPRMKEDIKAKLSSPQVRSRVYQHETVRYIDKINESALDFMPGALGLTEFLTSDQQIWQLRMTDSDAWTGLTKVYRVFQNTCCTDNFFSGDDCTVLKLKRLLTVNRMINLNTLLASMKTPHLLMIACEIIQSVDDELREIFKQLFNTLKVKKTMKIILTTSGETIADFLQQTARETLGEGLKTTDEQVISSGLTRSSQRKILEREVIFQGRRIHLNQLTSAEAVTSSFPLVDLLQERELRIGGEPVLSASSGYNGNCYIDRTFHHNVFVRQDISSDKREKKFADLLASDEQEFKQLCQDNPTKNVHLLVRDKSGELIWQQSQGKLSTLREYIDAQKSQTYGPTDLDRLLEQARYQRFMLIADKAGMGKTTVLTYLSKQTKEKFPAHWLVRIDLNDYTKQLEAQNGKKMSKKWVLEFVSKEVLKLESRLEKELFKKNFEGDEINKVVIMMDGFDEISPRYKETVIDMLQVLKQTPLEQVWVTTRPHLREKLEDSLQHLAYSLQPFTEVEQVEFLNKFWLQNSNLESINQYRLKIYAEALIRKLEQSISDKDKEFAGIPLQTRMLAEAFEEESKLFYLSEKSKPELPHKLDLLGLYGRFVDSKYDIYYREKSKTPAGNVAAGEQREEYLKRIQSEHQLLALQALFTEDEVTCLQINYEATFSDEQLARIGIAQRDRRGKPQFIHRTFAEYYVADFLINQLRKDTEQHIQVHEFVLDKVLLGTECHVIRAFLNELLKKSKPSLEALEYGEKLDELWEGEQVPGYWGGRALSQAATEDNNNIIGYLLDSLKAGHSKALKNMLLATDEWKRNAWHIAAINGNVPALEKIWECVERVTNTNTCRLAQLKYNFDETAFHKSTKTVQSESSEKPWNSDKKEEIRAEELKKQILLAQNWERKTAWHMAAEKCNYEILEKMWGWAKEVQVSINHSNKQLVLVKPTDGKPLRQTAAQTSSANILSTRWGRATVAQTNPSELQVKLLLGQDREGRTVWHVAAQRGSVELLDKLWGCAKEEELYPNMLFKLLLLQDKYGYTMWHATAERGSIDTLQMFMIWAKEAQLQPDELSELLLAKDNYEETVLHVTTRSGGLETLQILLSWAKEAQLKTLDVSKLLLARGNYGETVLHVAAKSRSSETLQILLSWAKEAQPKPDELSKLLLAKDKYEETVLHVTTRSGGLETLQILLSWAKEAQLKTLDVSKLLLARDNYGETVLHVAAKSRSSETLQTLLSWAKEAQLKPDELSKLLLAKSESGEAVLHAAANIHSSKILQTLLSWAKEAQLKPDQLSKLLLAKSNYGETVLHAEARRGRSEALESLSGAKEAQLKPDKIRKLLLAKDEDGQTMLLAAAKSGSSETLQILLRWAKEAQLIPDELSKLLLAKDKYGETVLHAAANTSSSKTLQILLSWAKEAQIKPVDISKLLLAKSKYGKPVLHAAANRGSSGTLQILLSWPKEAQLKPDELSKLLLAKDEGGDTVLLAAAKSGSSETLQTLLSWVKEAQLKPDELSKLVLAKDEDGKTVLHAAAYSGSLKTLQTLLTWAKKAELKQDEVNKFLLAKNKYGNTVWHAAAYSGSSKTLQTLLSWAKEAQLKPDELNKLLLAKNKYRETVLHAAARSRNSETIQILLSWAKEAQLKPFGLMKLLLAKSKYGRTVFHVAANRGSSGTLQILLSSPKEAQLKPDELSNLLLAKDVDGNTMLHAAAKSGSSETLQILLSWAMEAQLIPDELSKLLLSKDKYGETVLHQAANTGNSKSLQTLLSWAKEAQLKADDLSELLLAKSKYGETVLHVAARSVSSETLQILLSWANGAQLKPGYLSKLLLSESKDGETVLQVAAKSYSSEKLQTLLSWAKEAQLKADELSKLLLAKYKDGQTILHVAARGSMSETLQILLTWAREVRLKPEDFSKFVLSKDKNGKSVFYAAGKSGSSKTLQALLSWAKEAQLKPDDLSRFLLADDETGYTMLHRAAASGI